MSDVKLFTQRLVHKVRVIWTEKGEQDWPPTGLMDFSTWLGTHIQEVPSEHLHNAKIDFDSVVDGSSESWPEIEIYYYRPETDDEMQKRASSELDLRTREEKRERALLAQLQEKYSR